MPVKGSPYHSKGTWVSFYKNSRQPTFEITGYALSANMTSCH